MGKTLAPRTMIARIVLTITSNQEHRGGILVAIGRKTVVEDASHGFGRVLCLLFTSKK